MTWIYLCQQNRNHVGFTVLQYGMIQVVIQISFTSLPTASSPVQHLTNFTNLFQKYLIISIFLECSINTGERFRSVWKKKTTKKKSNGFFWHCLLSSIFFRTAFDFVWRTDTPTNTTHPLLVCSTWHLTPFPTFFLCACVWT